MNNCVEIDKCPISDSKHSKVFFTLGDIPLVNNLTDTMIESLTVDRYPLAVKYWHESQLTSLTHTVNSTDMFSKYLYKSGVSRPYIEHCSKMFEYINEFIPADDKNLYIDIGGNDGTLLKQFKFSTTKKIHVLNIEPSDVALDSINNGISTLQYWFSVEAAQDIVATTNKNATVITTTNVFQHLRDIKSFVKGIEYLLEPNGIWCLEFPYWKTSMKTGQFDQIYHEHMYYYNVTPLQLLFNQCGLKIIDATEQSIHGGSMRLIISKVDSNHVVNDNVNECISNESKLNLDYYTNWTHEINQSIWQNGNKLRTLIHVNHKKIFGFGAAAKGCIYLNALKLKYLDIPYVIDDTDVKINKFIPGTGIQVVSRKILKSMQPDYILILAHNFADYIIQSLKEYGYTGKFIILVPTIKIIN